MLDFMTSLNDADVSPANTWHDYGVYHIPSSASKLVICNSNPTRTPLFFANPSQYKGKKNKPDIALHAVQSTGLNAAVNANGRQLSAAEGKASPVIATAHFRNTRRTTGLAYGDPSTPEALHWEKMTQENLSAGRYSFTLPPPDAVSGIKHFASGFTLPRTDSLATTTSDHSAVQPPPPLSPSPRPSTTTPPDSRSGGRPLTWKRTHSLASGLQGGSLARHLCMQNWKLVDDATGAIVALFEFNGLKSVKKRGRLRVRRGELGEEDLWREQGLGLGLGLGQGKSQGKGGGGEQGQGHGRGGGEGQEQAVLLLGIVLSYCVIEERTRREGG